MKILSNDYRSNLPKEQSIAHGGPANFASNFSTFIAQRNHKWVGIIQQANDGEMTIINKAHEQKNKTYYYCSLPEVRYRNFLKLKKPIDPRKWFKDDIDEIRKFMIEQKPDVLFLNGFSVYAWLLLESASQENIPIVIQHAGIARVEFEQYKDLYSRAGIIEMIKMEADIVEKATTQIFLNKYSRDTFSKKVKKVPKDQSVIIPLPYAPELLKIKNNKNTPSSTFTIGCVARWDRIKNHPALIALAKEIRNQKLPWVIKSVTKIPDTKVHARLKENYRKNIEVIAPMERSELIKFYASVDVLVLPSHFDVSPTVVMESAMLNKPTLISKGVGWNTEYKESGLKDLIADFSKEKDVIKKIKNIIKNSPSTEFKEMIKKTHAPKTVFAKYFQEFSKAKKI